MNSSQITSFFGRVLSFFYILSLVKELNALCVIKLRMEGTKIRTNIGSSSEQYRNIVTLFWLLVDVCAELIVCSELITDGA